MKYFAFDQNNSGGDFTHDAEAGIGPTVFIQAENCRDANAKAESIGLYCGGVGDGIDCECCGDRWSSCYRDDGEDVPTLYGRKYRPVREGETQTLEWGYAQYIHDADGKFYPAIKIETSEEYL